MSSTVDNHNMPVALTIAGSDSGGGAGIQADLKTFAAMGVFGCSAVTAITAQNTRGVDGIWPVAPDAVAAQVRSVLNDLPVKAIKTGMLYQPAVVEAIVTELTNTDLPVVVDPVLVATSGDALSANTAFARQPIFWQLLRMAWLVTPNLDEAAQLLDTAAATSESDMLRQGEALIDAGLQGVLIKGGHLAEDNIDILLWRNNGGTQHQVLRGRKINTTNTHGTGCTLSAAIAAGLAKGENLIDAVSQAKRYITQAIEQGKLLNLGQGNGPVQHFFNFNY